MNTTPANPDTRTLLHTRQVSCHGYARPDGLFDIEGRMQDIKPHTVTLPFGTIGGGDAFHDMRITMTIDASLLIHRVEAQTAAGPTRYCPEISSAYAALSGLRIGPGFKKQVKERVGGVLGCTHLTQLIDAMATTAIQAMFEVRSALEREREAHDPDGPMAKPWVVDTCHTYRMGGEAVTMLWPEHRRQAARD